MEKLGGYAATIVYEGLTRARLLATSSLEGVANWAAESGQSGELRVTRAGLPLARLPLETEADRIALLDDLTYMERFVDGELEFAAEAS